LHLIQIYNISDSYQIAISAYEETKPADKDLAAIIVKIAKFLKEMLRYEDAESFMKRALLLTEKVYGKNNLKVAKVNYRMAQIYWNQGIWDPAETYCTKSLNLFESLTGNESLQVAKCLCGLGELNILRDPTKAKPFLERSLSIRTKQLGTQHILVSRLLHGIGSIEATSGNYEKAITLHKQAIQIREKMQGEKHPDLTTSWELLGVAYQLGDNPQQAEKAFLRGLELNELNHGKIYQGVASCCLWLAMALRAQNRHYEADVYQQKADTIQEALQAMGIVITERIVD